MAGLYEGEGCFMNPLNKLTGNRYPSLVLVSSDRDVVEQAAKITRATGKIRTQKPTLGNKPLFRTTISGVKAAGWMMTMYPLLGQRRRAKIRSILTDWKEQKRSPRFFKKWIV